MSDNQIADSHILAVDSHVHLYDWVNLVPMLDGARKSFAEAVATHKTSAPFSGVLALTEPADRDTYPRLASQLDQGEESCSLGGGWSLKPTAEQLSLAAVHIDGTILYLISGQQVVTRENLEVLSLFTEQTVPANQTLSETIAAIEARGGFAILPWGVGKWLFGRGKVISQKIVDSARHEFAIADNGGRPAFWSSVPQFSQARLHDLPILHGTDPLRVSETRRGAGSCGDIICCSFDPQKPGTSLLEALRKNSFERIPFGSPESTVEFVKDQLALRLS